VVHPADDADALFWLTGAYSLTELDWRSLVDVRFAQITTKFRIAPK
jgi:hypothetical protein